MVLGGEWGWSESKGVVNGVMKLGVVRKERVLGGTAEERVLGVRRQRGRICGWSSCLGRGRDGVGVMTIMMM